MARTRHSFKAGGERLSRGLLRKVAGYFFDLPAHSEGNGREGGRKTRPDDAERVANLVRGEGSTNLDACTRKGRLVYKLRACVGALQLAELGYVAQDSRRARQRIERVGGRGRDRAGVLGVVDHHVVLAARQSVGAAELASRRLQRCTSEDGPRRRPERSAAPAW